MIILPHIKHILKGVLLVKKRPYANYSVCFKKEEIARIKNKGFYISVVAVRVVDTIAAFWFGLFQSVGCSLGCTKRCKTAHNEGNYLEKVSGYANQNVMPSTTFKSAILHSQMKNMRCCDQALFSHM